LLELPPLSLYIHYPWCLKKCPYCDFNSHEIVGSEEGYIGALLNDLDEDLKHVQGRTIQSIFIGGGTPSLIKVDDLDELFNGLRERLTFDNKIEITLETNPGTFEVEKFKYFKQIGINRLSIGAQSFNDNNLKLLGRIHSSDETNYALEMARITGFTNINIDLMYGMQNQTISDSISDIERAIEFEPSHISLYQLTIEPNTYFAKFPPQLPDDDKIWGMGESGAKLLGKNGFERYEVSAYGKTLSKHNLNYWQFGDYIGIGAGAHGKITDINDEKIFRTAKPRSPKDYLNSQESSDHVVQNLAFDFMLNALRLRSGFDVSLFESRTGKSIDTIEDKLSKLHNENLLEVENTNIKASVKGFNFLNDLQGYFL
jgi:oxygen-independent coproporphyrinogen-3 oxidase